MNTPKRDKVIEAAANDYETKWHNQYPEGMHVADYVNDEMPGACFMDGAKWMLNHLSKLSEDEEKPTKIGF